MLMGGAAQWPRRWSRECHRRTPACKPPLSTAQAPAPLAASTDAERAAAEREGSGKAQLHPAVTAPHAPGGTTGLCPAAASQPHDGTAGGAVGKGAGATQVRAQRAARNSLDMLLPVRTQKTVEAMWLPQAIWLPQAARGTLEQLDTRASVALRPESLQGVKLGRLLGMGAAGR